MNTTKLIVVLLLTTVTSAHADTIAIIGTGDVDSVVGADMVVMAVPGMLVEEITLGLGDLGGKIIIDPSNPTRSSATGKRRSASASIHRTPRSFRMRHPARTS